MAAIEAKFNQKFVFADNPMVVRIHNIYTVGISTFPQLVVKVFTQMSGYTSREHQFVVSITPTQTEVLVDISSAVRSVTSQYEYNPKQAKEGNAVAYPYASFSIEAWERGLNSYGVVTENNKTSLTGNIAYFGGLSEFERWESASGVYPSGSSVSLSTKPDNEILFNGELTSMSIFKEGSDVNPGTISTSFDVVRNGNKGSSLRHTILFVNSRGVLETVGVTSRESKEYNISSELISIGRTPSYVPNPGLSTHKTLGPATWLMSSGYVNSQWAEWFATEFLAAKHYWMLLGGKWLPVAISTEDGDVVIYDRSDPSLRDISFTVRSAIGGRVG